MTNCPNCGAPVAGHQCEYCGTPFPGYRPPSYRSAVSDYDEVIKSTRKSRKWMSLAEERLRLDNELVQAKTRVLADADLVKQLYDDAINAMRAYGGV